MRQLLYRSGPVCIDLHIQPRPGMVAAEVTGQLLDSRRPSHIMRDIPVSLLYDGGAVSHQTTNQVGEFDFRVDSPRHLQLVFGIGKRKSVVVTVPDALV
ncbi:MAG TPA: hypothetical protein VLV49_18115 [Terriglobales bacterium]|nr:hypothetical protein [Terriglobales bacterium]